MRYFSKSMIASVFIGIFIFTVPFSHASSKSKIIEELFQTLSGRSDEVVQSLWKGSRHADELKAIAKRSGGNMSSRALAKKLGKAGDTDFIKKLDRLSSAERKVFSEIADTANDFLKSDPKRAVRIFNKAGVKGVHRARIMGKDSELFFRGIENEGRSFISVLDKGGPDAVRFYNKELLPRKGLQGFDDELTKFLKNPQRYIDGAGKPTKLGEEILKKFKRPRFKHPKLKEIKNAAKVAIKSIGVTLAAGIAGFLKAIPLFAALAAHSVAIAWSLLGIGLLLLLKLLKVIYRFFKPKAYDGKIFLMKDADGNSVQVSGKRVKRMPFIRSTAADKQAQEADIHVSSVSNWPIVATTQKGIIDIGIIGARAAGKSTFIIMLIDTFQRIAAKGISLQPDVESSTTQTAMNKYRNEIENYGCVRSTLEHVELLFNFRREQSDSYRFRMTDYPGEDLKPKEEISKEIGSYSKWLGFKDGLLLLVDPLRTDEMECRDTVGTEHVRPVVMQEEIIPFILHSLLGENNRYPKPVTCVLTKVDQLPESERNLPPDDLINKYFPQIFSALKAFAPHLKCFAISSTGGIVPDLSPGHPPVRDQFKPYGLDEPLYWLLKEMPERCLEIIKTNYKKWSWKSTSQTLQSFISRFQSSDVVNEAEALFNKLKRKHWLRSTLWAVAAVFVIAMLSIFGVSGWKQQAIARIQGQIEYAQREANYQNYERGLNVLTALESEITNDPEMLKDVRHKISRWANLLIEGRIEKTKKYMETAPQDYQQIFNLLEEFNTAMDQWGTFVTDQTYRGRANKILNIARDEELWQEELIPFINDVNNSKFDKYIKLTDYLDTTQADLHKIDAENRRTQIKQYLKENLIDDLKPSYERALSGKQFDKAHQLLNHAHRVGAEIGLSSEQQAELAQYALRLQDQKREYHHKTILVDVERLKNEGKWSKAVHLMRKELQGADQVLAPILAKDRDELIALYKNYTLAMVRKHKDESRIKDAIRVCNEFLSTPLTDEEVRALLIKLEVQRDQGPYKDLISKLSDDDYSANIKNIEKFIANLSTNHAGSPILREADKLKKSQLKTWAKSDYDQIYNNWYATEWLKGNRLDTTAKFLNEFIKRPFIEELGSNCPHIDSVKNMLKWYKKLQKKREYIVTEITIDKLEGKLRKSDLKIEITFGSEDSVEVETKNAMGSPYSFTNINQKFSWQPGDLIACKVYDTELIFDDDKYLQADFSKDDKYSLLKMIEKGIQTLKWEDDPKIKGKKPVIKLSVSQNGKEFGRPDIEIP